MKIPKYIKYTNYKGGNIDSVNEIFTNYLNNDNFVNNTDMTNSFFGKVFLSEIDNLLKDKSFKNNIDEIFEKKKQNSIVKFFNNFILNNNDKFILGEKLIEFINYDKEDNFDIEFYNQYIFNYKNKKDKKYEIMMDNYETLFKNTDIFDMYLLIKEIVYNQNNISDIFSNVKNINELNDDNDMKEFEEFINNHTYKNYLYFCLKTNIMNYLYDNDTIDKKIILSNNIWDNMTYIKKINNKNKNDYKLIKTKYD